MEHSETLVTVASLLTNGASFLANGEPVSAVHSLYKACEAHYDLTSNAKARAYSVYSILHVLYQASIRDLPKHRVSAHLLYEAAKYQANERLGVLTDLPESLYQEWISCVQEGIDTMPGYSDSDRVQASYWLGLDY